MMPRPSKRTREPAPSIFLAPTATSRASISDQATFGETGSVNTALSVLRCLLFTQAKMAFARRACKLNSWEQSRPTVRETGIEHEKAPPKRGIIVLGRTYL